MLTTTVRRRGTLLEERLYIPSPGARSRPDDSGWIVSDSPLRQSQSPCHPQVQSP
jgi:hypothetical protein